LLVANPFGAMTGSNRPFRGMQSMRPKPLFRRMRRHEVAHHRHIHALACAPVTSPLSAAGRMQAGLFSATPVTRTVCHGPTMALALATWRTEINQPWNRQSGAPGCKVVGRETSKPSIYYHMARDDAETALRFLAFPWWRNPTRHWAAGMSGE